MSDPRKTAFVFPGEVPKTVSDMSISEVMEGMLVAACFLRYALAVRMGDNYASPTSIAAFGVAHRALSSSDSDHLWRMLDEIAVPFSVSPAGRCLVIARRP